MKVDFYVLGTESRMKAWQFACQLLEKYYTEGKQAYVHTPTLQDAERFDALLWTFREEAFIPHALYQSRASFPPPIQIGNGEPPTEAQQILLNLADQLPASLQQFEQVIEIVFDSPTVQQLARERFRHYREQGSDITTHKLSEAEM